MSADLALAIDTMPDPDEASRYLGLWGVSAFLGAGLGGFAMSLMLEAGWEMNLFGGQAFSFGCFGGKP